MESIIVLWPIGDAPAGNSCFLPLAVRVCSPDYVPPNTRRYASVEEAEADIPRRNAIRRKAWQEMTW